MTDSQATAAKPNRFQTRLFFIGATVALAVAIPVLPLRFLGIPGPDFSDVAQVVTTSKNWLSKVASRLELIDDHHVGMAPPLSSVPAEQVKMLEAAAQQLNGQAEKSPCDPALQNQLGLVYVGLGDSERAAQHFQKAISLARLGITALSDKLSTNGASSTGKEASISIVEASRLNIELSAAHSNLARLYEKRGEHDKVIAELDLLNKEGVLFDSSAPGHQIAATPQSMLNASAARSLAHAEALLQARQIPAAADEYRRVITLDPNVALAHHRLGTILAMNNNAALAVDELEKAAKLSPSSPEIQNDLGLAYQMMGMQVEAIKAYEHALALEPRQTESAINLSNIYSAYGRIPEAIAVLTQAAQNNPSAAKVHNNLGTLLSLDGKPAPAMYEFQKAISLAPGMASAHYGLGTVLMQTKSYIPAAREFKQALALQPDFVEARLKIEEATRKAGMTIGSAQALN